jgi:hypothetical protein
MSKRLKVGFRQSQSAIIVASNPQLTCKVDNVVIVYYGVSL